MTFSNIQLCYLVILLPAGAGLLGFIIKRLRNEFNLLGFLLTIFFSIKLFSHTRTTAFAENLATPFLAIDFRVYIDNLSGFILLFNALFAFLIWLYSIRAISRIPRERSYHLFIGLTLSAANGVVISGNLFFLLLFWNLLLFSLYGVLLVGKKESHHAAQKALTIIGVSDYLMLLGIVILFVKSGNANFPLNPKIPLNDPLFIASYIMIFLGIIAKAGAVPLHSWIPEAALVVPASTMAYIPASLDKLVGIYLLVRLSYSIFDILGSLEIRIFLLIIGSLTIVGPVMMALVQKEAMRLLSFHAVSQVGYMILGIGTGIPVGIAGGLFHMLNHAIYKSCLFLSAGSVEYRTKTTNLENLGGLGVKMPMTMFSFFIAALAIAGVPPLNGFYSKCMVYQGVIEFARVSNLWVIFLAAAMFGTVLTLASFLKLIHSLFLGQRPKEFDKVREIRFEMVTPTLILALACIIFGIWSWAIPIKHLIEPALPEGSRGFDTRMPTTVALLMIIGLGIGSIIFLLGAALKSRADRVFIGGEVLDQEPARIIGPDFYSSVETISFLKKSYTFAEAGAFDFFNYLQAIMSGLAMLFKDLVNRLIVRIYTYFGSIFTSLAKMVSSIHTGELHNYLGWLFLAGTVILILLGL